MSLLLVAGFALRVLVQPGPASGFRINQAGRLAERGEIEAARQEMQAYLESRPGDADAWYRVGRAHVGMGHPVEATIHLRKALDLDPDSYRIRYQLGKALAAAGFEEHADAVLAEVLQAKADHAGALYLRSGLAAARGEVEASLVLFRAALDAGPEDPERFRDDARFDRVRNDPRFLSIVYDRIVPGSFADEET